MNSKKPSIKTIMIPGGNYATVVPNNPVSKNENVEKDNDEVVLQKLFNDDNAIGDYWHGLQQYLRRKGYEIKSIEVVKSKTDSRIKLIK